MGFALGLIKWIELKNLTDVLLSRSFIAAHPGTHIVSISGGSAQLGMVESQGQMTGLRQFKWSTHCSYRAPSKSMRLVHTVSQRVTFRNALHRSILCFFTNHGSENDLLLCNVTVWTGAVWEDGWFCLWRRTGATCFCQHCRAEIIRLNS